jgi:Pyridoxamine 5'-phosphate oxidase
MELPEVAPAFVEMAHRIVWCSAATVDAERRPRSRILHPIWEFDGSRLTGWIATGPTPLKRAHLAAHPFVSLSYWSPNHDTCTAECNAELVYDDATRTVVWDKFANGPAPVGYDPSIIPVWTSPTADTFAALKLDPWRLRVMPGEVMTQGRADRILTWRA